MDTRASRRVGAVTWGTILLVFSVILSTVCLLVYWQVLRRAAALDERTNVLAAERIRLDGRTKLIEDQNAESARNRAEHDRQIALLQARQFEFEKTVNGRLDEGRSERELVRAAVERASGRLDRLEAALARPGAGSPPAREVKPPPVP